MGAVAVTVAALLTGYTLAVQVQANAAPQIPQDDPFYLPPPDFADTAPGTILRSRDVPLAVLTALPIKTQSWQLLYRTTDLFGKPDATVTTVLLPFGAQPDPKRPLLSHQAFYDSANPACGPSYVLRQDAGTYGAEGMLTHC
ncbi:hypothetical protein [Nocardia sp. NPDC051570]|uniref:hypothetical protein n=1 Tax=Nocardia sp. NPDC051570 TaxID=3364324 RepID=UPI0037B53D44